MKFTLGTKVNMTQVFDAEGNVHPVTVISAAPITVVQIKNKEKDGYTAVQVGYGSKKEKNLSKPVIGHMKGLGSFSGLMEFRTDDTSSVNVGDKIDLGIFAEGDVVVVSGTSKGKGFQGVVKRYNFKGGPRSHGQKHSEREPGSIGGAGRDGGRVAKGKRMAGRTGNDRVTEKNHKIISIDKENNQILIEGAIPGRRGSLVEIRA